MPRVLWRDASAGSTGWREPIPLSTRVGSKAQTPSQGRWVTIRGRRVFVRQGGARPGSASVVDRPTKEQVAKWREQVDGWEGRRGSIAGDALYSIESDDHKALIVEDGGELKAIAAFQEPYFVEGGIMGPRKVGHSVTVPYLATKERGYGLRVMRELAQRAAEDGGLRFNATQASRGFYDAIGLGQYAQGGNLFNLTFSEAKTWLETSGQKAKEKRPRKVPEWLAESMEPEDGVFMVKEGSKSTALGGVTTGLKARRLARTGGRWRTLRDGRHVYVTGMMPRAYTATRSDAKMRAERYADDNIEAIASYMKIDEKEVEAKISETIDKFITGKPVSVNVPYDTAIQVLEDGRFKNQHETLTSSGTLSPSFRAKTERGTFEIENDAPPRSYPIYGHIGGSTIGMVGTYGEVKFELKDRVRSRTTMTVGDSLDGMSRRISAPAPVSRLHKEKGAWDGDEHMISLARGAFWDIPYFEAQIHGGVTVKDISRIVLGRMSNRSEAVRRLGEDYVLDLERRAKGIGAEVAYGEEI